jgi:hypothetical protein
MRPSDRERLDVGTLTIDQIAGGLCLGCDLFGRDNLT